jgi:hypothetical protein
MYSSCYIHVSHHRARGSSVAIRGVISSSLTWRILRSLSACPRESSAAILVLASSSTPSSPTPRQVMTGRATRQGHRDARNTTVVAIYRSTVAPADQSSVSDGADSWCLVGELGTVSTVWDGLTPAFLVDRQSPAMLYLLSDCPTVRLYEPTIDSKLKHAESKVFM